MAKGVMALVGIICIALALYLINAPFQYVIIPAAIKQIEPWILFVSGVVVLISGLKYLFTPQKHRETR